MRIVLSQFVIRVNKQKVINYLIPSLLVCLLLLYKLYFQMYGDNPRLQVGDFLTI